MPKAQSKKPATATPLAKNENLKGKKLTKKTVRATAHKEPERRNENKVRGR